LTEAKYFFCDFTEVYPKKIWSKTGFVNFAGKIKDKNKNKIRNFGLEHFSSKILGILFFVLWCALCPEKCLDFSLERNTFPRYPGKCKKSENVDDKVLTQTFARKFLNRRPHALQILAIISYIRHAKNF
jgi:hypothetical protein